MLFLPGSRAGHSSTRWMSVLVWHAHILPLLVVETSLPNAQPISGAVVNSSGSPSHMNGKSDLSAVESVTGPTAIISGEDMFHHEHKETTHVNPNVRPALHVGTELDVARQEVEVPGTHLARLPTARFLRSKGDQKMSSNTPSWHCLLYTSPSPRDKRQSRMPSSA